MDLGGDDELAVLDGWHRAERDGSTTFRWASREAALRIALDHPATLRVQVKGQAFMFADAPPQAVTLTVNGVAGPPLALPGAWTVVETLVPQEHWRAGVNDVRLTFARGTRPSDLGASTDQRDLSAAIDYLRVVVEPSVGAHRDRGAARGDPTRYACTSVTASKSLRILYAAIDQTVPGTLGGSVHVRAVAEGLAAMGHEVHALVTRGAAAWPAGPVRWREVEAPGGRPQFRLLAAREVTRIARAVEPDLVLERYHNFGGEGMLAARAVGAKYVLEVNAPVVDYPGSPKSRVDRALIVQPMRRWRERLVRAADLIVSPSAQILPDWVPADRVLEIEWGADTVRFNPAASGDVVWHRQPGRHDGRLRRRVSCLAWRGPVGRGGAPAAVAWRQRRAGGADRRRARARGGAGRRHAGSTR